MLSKPNAHFRRDLDHLDQRKMFKKYFHESSEKYLRIYFFGPLRKLAILSS